MVTIKRARAIRLRQLLPQSEIAERAGVTVPTLSRLERGLQEPHFVTIRRVAAALGVSPRALVDRPDSDTAGGATDTVTMTAGVVGVAAAD